MAAQAEMQKMERRRKYLMVGKKSGRERFDCLKLHPVPKPPIVTVESCLKA